MHTYLELKEYVQDLLCLLDSMSYRFQNTYSNLNLNFGYDKSWMFEI